ncbi:MAG: hypothetical protein P1U83_19260 [Roseovarius sp.]|nr:hypothetical protein [Roseovarius sp.]
MANKMMRRVTLTLVALMILGGCTERAKRIYFDGKLYPTREKAVSKDDRAVFVVTVRKAAQGIDGAREAGRHGGSKYCLKNFGTSQIEWVRGPDDAAETLQINNGALVLSGKCITW